MTEDKSAEAFYDEEVAPVLLELGRRCEERGLNFLAYVQYGPEAVGKTEVAPVTMSPQFKMASLAARSYGNADVLLPNIIAWAEESGHNSVYLDMLIRATNRKP